MIREQFRKNLLYLKKIMIWEQQHPYAVSFSLSLVITTLIIFYTPVLSESTDSLVTPEYIQFIDISSYELTAPKRVVKKNVTAENGDISNENNVDRAQGVSDAFDAVDLSYYPNIVPPKPIGNLIKRYPEIARKMNIEARLNLELLILSSGKVQKVRVVGSSLSKELPARLKKRILRAFARDAIIILKNARFTPPIVEGQARPVKMDMPLRFRLE